MATSPEVIMTSIPWHLPCQVHDGPRDLCGWALARGPLARFRAAQSIHDVALPDLLHEVKSKV
jgi:hypothetical protein